MAVILKNLLRSLVKLRLYKIFFFPKIALGWKKIVNCFGEKIKAFYI